MSEESDQDRTEEASEKRLREAREKGELPRSRELSTGVVVLAVLEGAEGPVTFFARTR